MKINGIEVEKVLAIPATIYVCPYCGKKLINKSSYRNHITKGYCLNYFLDLEIAQKKYKNNEITTQQFYEWVYENGYIEMFNITEEEKKELSENFINKIESLYNCDSEEY